VNFDCRTSLIIIGLSVSDIIGSIDGKVSGIDVVSFDCRFEELRVVHSAVLEEVQLFILHILMPTFMFTPQILSSSASTLRSYFN